VLTSICTTLSRTGTTKCKPSDNDELVSTALKCNKTPRLPASTIFILPVIMTAIAIIAIMAGITILMTPPEPLPKKSPLPLPGNPTPPPPPVSSRGSPSGVVLFVPELLLKFSSYY
ncbi:MAG: hypothetical protein ACRD8W_32820, partial [Nitrososphaeraceae archaeon]